MRGDFDQIHDSTWPFEPNYCHIFIQNSEWLLSIFVKFRFSLIFDERLTNVWRTFDERPRASRGGTEVLRSLRSFSRQETRGQWRHAAGTGHDLGPKHDHKWYKWPYVWYVLYVLNSCLSYMSHYCLTVWFYCHCVICSSSFPGADRLLPCFGMGWGESHISRNTRNTEIAEFVSEIFEEMWTT